MTTTTKRAVAIATRVAEKDKGNGKSGKSIGDGNKEGDLEEEGNGKQQQYQNDDDRDNSNNNHNNNDNSNEYKKNDIDADDDDIDNNKNSKNNSVAAAASCGWQQWGRAISRGNSKSFNENPEIIKKTMNKDNRYSHVIPLDILICLLSSYLRHTTQTMVIKEGKNPHLCYNASTTKKSTDIVMNQRQKLFYAPYCIV
jgi:hypothetical protein